MDGGHPRRRNTNSSEELSPNQAIDFTATFSALLFVVGQKDTTTAKIGAKTNSGEEFDTYDAPASSPDGREPAARCYNFISLPIIAEVKISAALACIAARRETGRRRMLV